MYMWWECCMVCAMKYRMCVWCGCVIFVYLSSVSVWRVCYTVYMMYVICVLCVCVSFAIWYTQVQIELFIPVKDKRFCLLELSGIFNHGIDHVFSFCEEHSVHSIFSILHHPKEPFAYYAWMFSSYQRGWMGLRWLERAGICGPTLCHHTYSTLEMRCELFLPNLSHNWVRTDRFISIY